MLKLLKKYKMQVLVGFGILIIISFLLADTLQRLGRSAQINATRFSIGPDKITQGDEAAASTGLEAVMRSVVGGDARGQAQFLEAMALPQDARLVAWLMRTTEARRAGLLGGTADGRAMAMELAREAFEAEQQRRRGSQWREAMKAELGLTDEQLTGRINDDIAAIAGNMLAMATVSQPVRVDGAEAFAQLRGLRRQMDLYRDVVTLSGPRLISELRRGDEAIVDYTFLPVDPAKAATLPEPTEAELIAHFDRFKGVLAGKGDFGMGYKAPDRVAFQRLTIDRVSIAAKVVIDPVDVQKKLASESPKEGETPSDARRRIEQALREAATDRAVREAAGGVRAEFLRVIGTWPERAGYRVIPEGFDPKRLDFATIAQTVAGRVREQTGTPIDPPQLFVQAEPVSREELARQLSDTFSFSVAFRGQEMVPALNALFETKELNSVPPAPEDQLAAMGRGLINVQVGVPVVEAFEMAARPDARGVGTQHFVMVTRALPSAEPASIDAVRAQVVADVKKVKAIEALRAEVEKAVPAAGALGMSEALNVLRSAGISAELRTGASVTQFRGLTGPDRKRDTNAGPAEVVDAIMAQARRLNPTVRLDSTTGKDRVFLLVPPGRLGVVLGRIEQFKPMAREQLQLGASILKRVTRDQTLSPTMASHFSAEAMSERLNVSGLDLRPAKKAPGTEQSPGGE